MRFYLGSADQNRRCRVTSGTYSNEPDDGSGEKMRKLSHSGFLIDTTRRMLPFSLDAADR